MSRQCKDCIHNEVCDRDVGHGWYECPQYISADVVEVRHGGGRSYTIKHLDMYARLATTFSTTKSTNIAPTAVQKWTKEGAKPMFNKKKSVAPLRRCAFCGAFAEIHRVSDAKQLLVYKCSNCGQTPVRYYEAKPTEQKARNVWNKRTEEAEYIMAVYAHSKSTIFTRKDTERRR